MFVAKYKITKKELRHLSAEFYLSKKAYYKMDGHDHFEVGNVFISNEDYEYYKACVFKKHLKRGLSVGDAKQATCFEELSNAPNKSLGDVIKPGWCIVIDDRHGRQ